MAFVGLVRSERSFGERRRHESITEVGNAHVRRLLVESAGTRGCGMNEWAIRFGVLRCSCCDSMGYEVPPSILASGFGSVWTACSRRR